MPTRIKQLPMKAFSSSPLLLVSLIGVLVFIMPALSVSAQTSSQTSKYELAQLQTCENLVNQKQFKKAITACVPLVWANDLSIRGRASDNLNKSATAHNGQLHWQRTSETYPTISDPFMLQGACPFEGCTFGVWVASKTIPVYDRRGDKKKILWTIAKGERVAATYAVLHVHPVKGEVVGKTDQASLGQPVYLLDYLGEGVSNIWVRGAISTNDKLSSICKPSPSCQSAIAFPVEKAPSEWWVKVVRRNEQIGWVRGEVGFKNNDRFGGDEVKSTDQFDIALNSSNPCLYPDDTTKNRWLIEAALGRMPGQCVSFPYLAKYSNPEAVMPLHHAGMDIKADHQTAYAVVDGEVTVDCQRGAGVEDTACKDT